MQKKKTINFFVYFVQFAFLLLWVTCSSSGPVSNELSDENNQVVVRPDGFLSPTIEIDNAYHQLDKLEEKLEAKKLLNTPAFVNYLEWYDVATALEYEQQSVENELQKTGQLVLEQGRSYSFDLESFCVHIGIARPVLGDGFKIAKMKGKALEWLPELLQKYSAVNISQDDAQVLIWALLTDVRYDELSVKNQTLLLRIFPNAATKFGNREVENALKDIIDSVIPSEVNDAIEQTAKLRDSFLTYQEDVNALVDALAPTNKRTVSIPVGWIKTEAGYYIQITSSGGYSKIHVDIYMPSIKNLPRSPSSSLDKIIFRPSEWIALPSSGQRLAFSPNVIKKVARQSKISPCAELTKWKPQKCQQMKDDMREKILTLSDPTNFLKTRYASPPNAGATIEDETDCTHFVQEIYKRAGFPFHYSPSGTFACLQVFKEIKEDEAKAGDIVLYKGHVGILNKDGMLISSTIGGKYSRYSTLDPNDKNFRPSITVLPINGDFGKGRFMTWRCE